MWEGEAPAEPRFRLCTRLGGSLGLAWHRRSKSLCQGVWHGFVARVFHRVEDRSHKRLGRGSEEGSCETSVGAVFQPVGRLTGTAIVQDLSPRGCKKGANA